MNIKITFDNDEQRAELARFLPKSVNVEAEGATTDDLGLVRRILLFLRFVDREVVKAAK